MNRKRVQALAAAAALAGVALAPAAMAAPTCFTVYDRQGEITYRNTVLPFEGAADPASAGRIAMRERGEHLVFFEADFCVPVAAKGPDSRPATTEEIVAAIPAYGSRGVGTGATPGGVYASGSGAPSPRPGAAVVYGGPAARITAPAAAAIGARTATYR